MVVFDAMGVLYSTGDDESDLLIPYLRQLGCGLSDARIRELYRETSLGKLSSAGFWRACSVNGDDMDYCSRHSLQTGIEDVLSELFQRGVPLGCLSNDVSEWSRILRRRFGLDRWIQTWSISGDLGLRKPDPAIFLALSDLSGVPSTQMIFFDDLPRNVEAALNLGIDAILFTDISACRHALQARNLLPS